MKTQGNPSWTAVIKPLVSPGLWSQQNSMTVGLMPTLYASLTSEFRWFSSNDLTEVRITILQSLQNLCSVAWQICLHVSFHLLRLEEGRRGVTWWFLAYLLAEHWEHRCCPFKIADLLLPQHAGFGGLPVSCGSDAQSSFPTSNLQRQRGRTRSSDRQNYMMGETSDCKKCIWLEGESCFQEWARCIRQSRKKSSGKHSRHCRHIWPMPKEWSGTSRKLCFLYWLSHWMSRWESLAKPFRYMLQ